MELKQLHLPNFIQADLLTNFYAIEHPIPTKD